jgi:hypothetical protein
MVILKLSRTRASSFVSSCNWVMVVREKYAPVSIKNNIPITPAATILNALPRLVPSINSAGIFRYMSNRPAHFMMHEMFVFTRADDR